MATTVNLNVNKLGYVRADAADTHYSTSSSGSYLVGKSGKKYGYYRLYYGFPLLSSTYQYYPVNSVRVNFSAKGDGQYYYLFASSDFNANTITYNTKPSTSDWVEEVETSSGNTWKDNYFLVRKARYDPLTFLRNGAFCISAEHDDTYDYAPYGRMMLANGSSYANVQVTLGDKISLTPSYKAGPKDGAYSNPRNNITFQWVNTATGDLTKTYAGSLAQSSAIFYWKTSTASSWNSVNVSGASTSVTIAANTFPVASTIQWYVRVTDAGGTSTNTSTFSFSTTAQAMVATTVSPKGSVEENNAPITFRWNLSSADGFPASRVVLEWYKTSTSSWETLTDTNSAITSYTAAANTFPTGEINWRVKAYNVDSVAGSYSTATFTSFGAPNAPVLDSDQVPFTTITWQASEQEAYEINIDGKQYGPYFGTDKSFTLVDYLEDGQYTAKVRVLGQYSLWSAWGEITLYIQNVPGEDVNLTAKTFVDADLSWATEELTSDFLIYRNGKQIGHTTGNTFIDRLANGETEYFVVNRLADGNYSKSQVLQRNIKLDNTYIAEASGGEWFVARYTTSVAGNLSVNETIDTSFTKIAGKVYPTASVSEFRTTIVSMSTAFLNSNKEEQKRFLSLQGKPVIAKFKDGRSGVFMITSLRDQRNTPFYVEYSFTMQQIDWEDYIDE